MPTTGSRDRWMAPAVVLLPLFLSAGISSAAVPPCTLGLLVTDISPSIRRLNSIPGYVTGAYVRVVQLRSPARNGVQVGDIIEGVDSTLIQNACGLKAAIAKHGCGDVRLTIRRGTETMKVGVHLAAASSFRITGGHEERACQEGDGAACLALAKRRGEDLALLRRGCDLGDSDACYLLGSKLGETGEAAAAYQQACDGGNALACTDAGWMYQYGRGVGVDLTTALHLYERGCDGGPCTGPNNLGCVNLGRLYRDGIGVEQDLVHATQLFRRICARTPKDDRDASNVARACSLAGTSSMMGMGIVRNMEEAVKLLKKGCDAADPFGCFNLGVIYEGGYDLPADKARAITYYQRACEHDDAESCDRLAALRK